MVSAALFPVSRAASVTRDFRLIGLGSKPNRLLVQLWAVSCHFEARASDDSYLEKSRKMSGRENLDFARVT